MLAPIVLFVYNRPLHTEQTLTALMNNELADESVLYIYADGAKDNATDDQLQKIAQVRALIRSKKWCGKVNILESEKNSGLAQSIITGVTKIVNEYSKIIVLEDDLVTSTGFLRYMNSALDLYQHEEKAFHISGYMFPVKEKLPETFFYTQTSCWGWGTWAKKWKFFNPSAADLYQKIHDSGRLKSADIDGTNQFVSQLKENINGTIKTWAVLWHFSVFLQNGLCLHPGKSLVKNIGIDNSGENCTTSDMFDVKIVNQVAVKKVAVTDYLKVYDYLKRFYKGQHLSGILFHARKTINSIIPPGLKRKLKMFTNENFKQNELAYAKIKELPRFIEAEVLFLDKQIKIVDNASFLFIKKELFEEEIYKFNAGSPAPLIIDCGANIGMSVIYFKTLFPAANIIAFEPDKKVFDTLVHNVKVFGFSDVQLINKACWNEETTLQFFSEGADGGRAAKDFDRNNLVEVATVRLQSFLNKKIDFLKIDIEGAEVEVILDIQEQLHYVERIFVEYHSFIGKDQMLPEIIAVLKNAGFRLYLSSPGLQSKNPFLHVNSYSNMDNQLNIYGVRI